MCLCYLQFVPDLRIPEIEIGLRNEALAQVATLSERRISRPRRVRAGVEKRILIVNVYLQQLSSGKVEIEMQNIKL